MEQARASYVLRPLLPSSDSTTHLPLPTTTHDNAPSTTPTDLVSKEAALRVTIGGVPVAVGGMCKGSGMIHPNMATMLGVVTTDAAVDAEVWRGMLRRATDASFNAVRRERAVVAVVVVVAVVCSACCCCRAV